MYQRNYTYSLKVAQNDCEIYLVRAKDFDKVIKGHRDTWVMVEESCRERNQALLDSLISVYKTRWLQKET